LSLFKALPFSYPYCISMLLLGV